jgi:hypothetical protein
MATADRARRLADINVRSQHADLNRVARIICRCLERRDGIVKVEIDTEDPCVLRVLAIRGNRPNT